jgi:hypothetical protein
LRLKLLVNLITEMVLTRWWGPTRVPHFLGTHELQLGVIEQVTPTGRWPVNIFTIPPDFKQTTAVKPVAYHGVVHPEFVSKIDALTFWAPLRSFYGWIIERR